MSINDNITGFAPAGQITPDPENTIDAPNTLTPDASTPIGTPDTVTPVGAGSITAPNTINPDAVNAVDAPNTLTPDAANNVDAPNTLAPDAVNPIATPVGLSPLNSEPINRVLTPLIGLNFSSQNYSVMGQPSTFDNALTYSRASSATYVETYVDALNRKQKRVTTVGANVPRFEDAGLLVEGASTNLALRSEEFDSAEWVKSGATVTANSGLAPDLTNSADKISAASTGTISVSVSDSVVSVIGTKYTASFYVKAAEQSAIQIAFGAASVTGSPRANFNLVSGEISIVDSELTAEIKKIGNDGWYRISATATAATTSFQFFAFLINDPLQGRAVTSSFAAGNGLLLWGAQVEALGGASSYIKTEGAAVSRAADITVKPFSISRGNLSVKAKALFPIEGSQSYVATLFNANVNSSINITNADNLVQAFIRAQGGITLTVTGTSTTQWTSGAQVSLNFAPNDCTVFIGNETPVTDNSVIIPTVATLSIGNIAQSSPFYGHIEYVNVYDTLLTANEVKSL